MNYFTDLERQIQQAIAAELIANLLLDIGFLIALSEHPESCVWRPP